MTDGVKWKKGDKVWVASEWCGNIDVEETTVLRCGEELVWVKSGPATHYRTQVGHGFIHATRAAALEHLVERQRNKVARVESTVEDEKRLLERIEKALAAEVTL